MISYIGQFFSGVICLLIILFFLLLQINYKSEKRLDYIFFLFPKLNFIIINILFTSLAISYLLSDFSLITIGTNSHSSQPLLYKLGATWGNHEGSMILWNWVLALYIYIYSNQFHKFDLNYKENTLKFLFFTQFAFTSFTYFTSNPFIRTYNFIEEGSELNPVLQDPGLIIHPPILYLGYLSTIILFATVYGILTNNEDTIYLMYEKVVCVKKWTLYCWIMLSIGIMLGSWWAYYELGWGGWWFWDPVENIALMPWLVVTSIYHHLLGYTRQSTSINKSLAVLAGFSFVLSILGTFFVRSGLLSSVHSFATSTSRGLFILFYFVIICGVVISSIIKYTSYEKEYTTIFSKKFLMYLNTLLFFYVTVIVFTGTFFPTLYEVFIGKDISIGPLFYIKTIMPVMTPLVLLMTVVPYIKMNSFRSFADIYYSIPNKSFLIGLNTSIALFLIILYKDIPHSFLILLLLNAILIATVLYFLITHKASLSMSLGHLGFAWFLISAIISSYGHKEITQLLKPGEKVSLGNKVFTFRNTNLFSDSNYKSFYCDFIVQSKETDKVLTVLFPEKRFYKVKKIFTTKSSIHSNLYSDVYASIGDGNVSNGWYIKLYYSPLMPHIWISSLLVIAGGSYSLYKEVRKDDNKV